MQQKKILILGGNAFSLDIVKEAKSLGLYVVAANRSEYGVAMDAADEKFVVELQDIDAVADYVKDNHIEGIMAGPSEFHTLNMIKLCERTGLRCYATSELWDICSNKETFKTYCIKNNVPTAPEYFIESFQDEGNDSDIEYPLIVKPVDGCSSKGISICHNREDVLKAYAFALDASICKKAVIEKYIDNGGSIFCFRYVIDDGKFYPYLTFDTYITDPIDKKYLISAFTYCPSTLEDKFYSELNEYAQSMLADMGIKNGVAFIQAIPCDGKIYCHEMGYRLSGGMIYKLTEPLMGINDMKMMTRYAIGGSIITPEEIEKIKNRRRDLVMAQLMIPLNCGIIKSVSGLDEILKMDNVVDFLQYYHEGDEIVPQVIGTLGQHFGRFTLSAKNKEEMLDVVNQIQTLLLVENTEGEDMYSMKFDTKRVK